MKKIFVVSTLLLLAAFSGCSDNKTDVPTTTTISGTIAISATAGPKPSYSAEVTLSAPAESMGEPLTDAIVELYDADRPDWLYPVAETMTDGAGNYCLSKLANAASNGNAYQDQNPIPSGNYTVVAYKYDANIGKLYVAVQTVVKNFKGAVDGNNLIALDQGIDPAVQDIAGLPKNVDGTFGSPANVLPENAAIQVTFNTAMARFTLLGAISIKDLDGNILQGTWKVSADILSATFYPANQLNAGAVYTITVLGGADAHAARNLYGNPIPATVTGTFVSIEGDETPPSIAKPGDLDTGFGSEGTITLKLGDISSFAYAIAVQADGKSVVGGYSYSGNVPQFTLARLNIDGSLDATFGSNGIVVTAFSTDSGSGIYALAIQPDGKIVAAGNAPGGFGLARYNVNGSLDTAFGTNGKLATAVGQYAGCRAVGLQPDGKIVVAGTAWNGANHDVVVVRYTAGGSLDTSFNLTGKVMTGVAGGHDQAFALAVQGDGKIVVGGYADTAQGRNFAVLRYQEDGILDSVFGTGGKVTTPLGSSQINALGIQADGKIVAAGYQANDNFWQVAVARYNTDGSLDSTFDGDGIVMTTVGNWRSAANALALLPDGRILIAGYSGTTTLPTDMLLIRYNADGSPDAEFGSGGSVITDIAGGEDSANAIAIQPDGDIVAAGRAFVGQSTGIAVARYLSN